MPLEPRILTEDRITGEVKPLGYITGFDKPHIRSAWPDNPTGKPLTDRRIAMYAKKGKYFAIHAKLEEKRTKFKKKIIFV